MLSSVSLSIQLSTSEMDERFILPKESSSPDKCEGSPMQCVTPRCSRNGRKNRCIISPISKEFQFRALGNEREIQVLEIEV